MMERIQVIVCKIYRKPVVIAIIPVLSGLNRKKAGPVFVITVHYQAQLLVIRDGLTRIHELAGGEKT